MTHQPLYYIQPSAAQGSAADFQLDSYILHVKTQHCCGCGKDHLSSQLFEVHVNPRMTGQSGAHRLVAVHDKMRGGYRIGISKLRPEETLCCHECVHEADGFEQIMTHEQWKSDLQNRFVGFGASIPKERRASSEPTVYHPKNPTIKDL